MSKRKLDDGTTYGQMESFQSNQYKVFEESEKEIMFQPSTIKRYIININELQKTEGYEFYPLNEERLKIFFDKINPQFNYENIKYNESCDLDTISKIISYIGKSGYNYITSAIHQDKLYKPVLLFYGIEQLSTFYSYLQFNFTPENSNLNALRKIFRKHGIDPWEFNNVESSADIETILNSKIKLTKKGAAQRFFFVLGFPLEEYFFNQTKFSLMDLMTICFSKLKIGISSRFFVTFLHDFDPLNRVKIEYHQDLDLLIYYILIFLFSHLSRYKIFTWQKLINCEEGNLGFYIDFLIKRINDLFLRKILSIMEYEREQIIRLGQK